MFSDWIIEWKSKMQLFSSRIYSITWINSFKCCQMSEAFALMNRHKLFVISNIDLYYVCLILLRRLSTTPATLFTILIFSINFSFVASAVVRLCTSLFRGFQIHNEFKKFNHKSRPEKKDWYFEGGLLVVLNQNEGWKFENTFY